MQQIDDFKNRVQTEINSAQGPDSIKKEIVGGRIQELAGIVEELFGLIPTLGAGEAIPATDPGDKPVGTWYNAFIPGIYANFDGIEISVEEPWVILSLGEGGWSKGVVNIDLSGSLTSAKTSNVFVNVNTDERLDIRELILSGTDPDRRYFLGNFQNYFDGSQYLVRIDIKDDLGNIVTRLNSQNATQAYSGLMSIAIGDFGSSGVRGRMTINFDSSYGIELQDFNYELSNTIRGSRSDAFTDSSPSFVWGVDRVTCDNPAALDEPIYLRAFRNASNQTLIRIETASQIIAYLNAPATAPRTGREILSVSQYLESGYNFTLQVNWDQVTHDFNSPSSTNYILNPVIVQPETETDVETYPFVKGTEVIDMVDIRDINPADATGLVDANGFAKEYHFRRGYNWHDPNYTGYRALLQIADSGGSIVAQFFETSLSAAKSGVEAVTLTKAGGGTTDWIVVINWDALADNTTGSEPSDLGYVIDSAIIYRRVDLASGGGEVTVYEPLDINGAKTYHAIDTCSTYLDKLFSREEDVNIVLLGDSLTARTDSITPLLDPSNMAPWMVAESWPKHLYERYIINKPFYQRWDSGAFTETGAFTDGYDIFEGTGGVPQWSRPSRQEGNRSRYSTDSGAAVSLSWNLDAYEKMNFVHDLDYRAAQQVTVSIGSGNGSVEAWNGSAWVEANGYQFSQWIDDSVATDGSGHALSVNKVRMKFRRATAATGTVTISFTKDGTADYFFYWGTEMWNGATVHIHNAARGGHETAELRKSLLDLEYYGTDLIIFELPLINEINQFGSGDAIVNHQWDFIWGDRPGNETDSLKSTYPNANIVAVVPHIDKENWSGDLPVIGQAGTLNDASGLDVIERCKALFLGRVDVQYIDVFNEMVQIAKINGWTIEQAFTGAPATSKASFNRDSSHQNDYGHRVWAASILNNLKV